MRIHGVDYSAEDKKPEEREEVVEIKRPEEQKGKIYTMFQVAISNCVNPKILHSEIQNNILYLKVEHDDPNSF